MQCGSYLRQCEQQWWEQVGAAAGLRSLWGSLLWTRRHVVIVHTRYVSYKPVLYTCRDLGSWRNECSANMVKNIE